MNARTHGETAEEDERFADRSDRDRGDDECRDDERSEDERREGIRRLELDLAIARSPELRALETQLYGHVLECIDFDGLFGLEQLLWHLIDKLGFDELGLHDGLSKALIQRAIMRAARDPSTSFSDVPFGITKAEAKAAKFDPECPFCQYEAEHPREASDAEHEHDDEPCSLCDEMAREWHEKHADALRRRGLR